MDGRRNEVKVTRLRCQRTGQLVELVEHGRCPYCFGTEVEVAQGDYERFCDFHPEEDAIVFGFPEDGSRHLRG